MAGRDIKIMQANLQRLKNANASEEEMDQYVQEEGWQPEEFISAVKESGVPDTSKPGLGGFAKNVGKSYIQNQFVLPFQAVTHPVKTVEGLTSMGSGAIATVLSPDDLMKTFLPKNIEQMPEVKNALEAVKEVAGGDKRAFHEALTFLKDRYGGWEQMKNTAYNDPVGILYDLSAILQGAGGVAKGGSFLAGKAGMGGMAGKLAQAGKVASVAGDLLNPTTAILKGAGKAVMAGKQILGGPVNKVRSPFKKSYQPEVAQTFKEAGVPYKAADVTTSQQAAQFEAFAEKGFFGRKIAETKAQQITSMNKIAEDTAKAIGETDPENTAVLAGIARDKMVDRMEF